MTDTNYLLDAVDKLTLTHVTRVMQSKTVEQRGDEGELIDSIEVACISVVDHDPLLLQLRDAVAGGTGSKGGSSDGSARIPFDPGAQALFDEMARKINAWYIVLPNAKEERHIHDRLRDWYLDYENRRRAGKTSDVEDADTLRLVNGWARSIEAMFDPPKTEEITQPCPVCGGRYAIDPKTGDRITALVIEYRNLGAETLDKVTGLCRSCTAVWRGGSGMREMRWAIDNPEGEHVTVGGYTIDQVVAGIDSALEVRNWKAAASLVDLLATVEPDTAQTMRGISAALKSNDAAKAQAEREARAQAEREAEAHKREVDRSKAS